MDVDGVGEGGNRDGSEAKKKDVDVADKDAVDGHDTQYDGVGRADANSPTVLQMQRLILNCHGARIAVSLPLRRLRTVKVHYLNKPLKQHHHTPQHTFHQ
jgi:hypothetical protein